MSRTKEAILQEESGKLGNNFDESILSITLEEGIKNAMDEYAKSFALWLSENTTVVEDYPNIKLFRYCDRDNEWGNYILDDIYLVFLEEMNK